MSKFTCRCGHIINLSGGTTDSEWTLVPEKTIDEIGDVLSEGKALSDEGFYDTIVENGITTYRCPACGRLHLEEAGRNQFVTYVKEVIS
ncbi:hypothetical protein [Paraburkholderia rhynchosiae]|uniref:Uncharacterized protein n=1 Tax=Paraburkholderia rhynchosiae TaxID=487049 RepID=A0A2N7WAN9_9BURK|nr:hypothetical protein [Paraburkholderia rhynchosiae]PMS26461.1 hypothetical protein C0Z16_27125 [Paraburkholderia rhynchosiae]CAB3716375.1 hypothetical protein LMG27174_04587 [Paraburkholderia rhynchosiae]